MTEQKPRRTLELSDPRALRALAHPVRLTLIGLLRREGPLTATQAAARVGESPANCSFHLRQLAKHGFVEEAGGGRGRERPWRATAEFTSWPAVADDPELDAASQLLSTMVVERYFERVLRWVGRRDRESTEWREAAVTGDAMLYLTRDELEKLGRELETIVERYQPRTVDPSQRPQGSRPIAFIQLAFPDEGQSNG